MGKPFLSAARWVRLRLGIGVCLLLAFSINVSSAGQLNPRLRLIRSDNAPGGARTGFGVSDSAVQNDPWVKIFLRLGPGVKRAALVARYPSEFFGPQIGNIVTARVHTSVLDAIDSDTDIEYAEASVQYRFALDVAKSSETAGGDFLGVLDPSYTNFGTNLGQGVVIGFVDSGIDFDHFDFREDGDTSKSRILYIWDQTNSDGSPPSGFSIGSEWTKAQIETEIASSPGVVTHIDVEGHGTHVAGIAAGDGSDSDGSPAAGTYVGMAPQADIIMVRTTYSGTDIVDGVSYIIAKAAAAGKRAVINLSLSGQDGPHDGTLSMESSLNTIAASTPIVIAQGNDQLNDAHASFNFPGSGVQAFTFNRFNSASLLTIDFWGDSGDQFTLAVTDGVNGTITATNGQSPSGSLGTANIDLVNNLNSHPSGDPEYFIRITGTISEANYTFTFTRTVNGGSGRLDGWVFDTAQAKFTNNLDATRTMGSPGVVANAITVGSYCGRSQWANSGGGTTTDTSCNANLGAISNFSGAGPTRDGRQKPDIAAPGERVLSALGTDMSPGPSVPNIGADNRHRAIQGTSMATPIVAGAVALKIQQNPGLTAAQIKSDIQNSGRTDSDTGALSPPNSNTWGYGKLKVIACGNLISAAPTVGAPTTLGSSSITWTFGTVLNADSYNIYYETAPATLIANVASSPFLFENLDPNTTYGFEIKGTNPCGEGPGTVATSTSTLAIQLAGATFATEITSITASYTALGGQNEGYLLRASTAPDFTGTVISSSTPNSNLASLRLDGLDGLTTYYLRLGTLNSLGAVHFISVGPELTNTSLVAPGPITFSNMNATSIQSDWTLGTNPAGLQYIASASTSSDFTGTVQVSNTFNLNANFTSLDINTTYYFRVRAATGPFGGAASTSTLAATPTPTAATFIGITQSSMTVQWLSAPNPSGTRMLIESSTNTDFGTLIDSSNQTGSLRVLNGLDPNTTVYVRISALNHNSLPTTTLSFATSTLADVPGLAAQSFLGVTSSITVQWIALPSSPSSATARGYVVEASTSPDFSPVFSDNTTSDGSASSLGIDGLLFQTTYYIRVGALNWNGVAGYLPFTSSFLSLGSSVTVVAILSSATATNTENIVLTITPSVNQLTYVQIDAPVGTLPVGVRLTVNASVPFTFDSSLSIQANLVPLGEGVAFDIEAQGVQPLLPVTIRMDYDPNFFPPGFNKNQLVIGHFRDGVWTVLETRNDKINNILRAETRHFSLFAPFFSLAASALDNVRFFPNPWMPGSGDAFYDAARLTFSNLPADGKVKIYSILGELLWEENANAGGLLFWDGKNKHGVDVGSASYILVITAGSERRISRVTVVR